MKPQLSPRSDLLVFIAVLAMHATPLLADDWPEWRGQGRRGVWNETGILEKFPEGGLKVEWRVPIRAGYSGPSVASGRVFISDFLASGARQGTERAVEWARPFRIPTRIRRSPPRIR